MFSHLFFFFLFFFAFSVSFSLSIFLLYKSFNKAKKQEQHTQENDSSVINHSLSKIIDKTCKTSENNQTHLTRSLLLDILPSDSPKWASLFGDETRSGHGDERNGLIGDSDYNHNTNRVKKKKKRAKKKRLDLKSEEENGAQDKGIEREMDGSDSVSGPVKQELVCLYPFTSSSSATQRKIKQQYDHLVKCNESKGLTLAQVGDFANCLIEARNELQHKSEVIKRKFTITKALLLKADRSSIDRLRQQIYKLELEQKRLEEDTFVYNWLQQQLKLSPAYKKMLEISACMELKAKSGELIESSNTEVADISFEELLAQEKKDVFWQKNGKSRLHSN
ncbi:uncharacterized protein LOC8266965 [Ricinus communis]|uniref:CA-responsive protein n=1 Tax=Ricinus communis TaxID=3988 RepID=B9SN39_RICCO|nr:uncharacterized protein LOC8266965 [Ricinus communis]EEF34974.1 conserved hypothetical protein [Ricinus communis]|eukprot:XP_002527408.1 uncharacterized protein LOC8266965 [Ricinus communis]